MKIVFTGGGTAGSVVPLIAIHNHLEKSIPGMQTLFIGTRRGQPEKALLRNRDIIFTSIFSGKMRRYFDIRNLSDTILILIGFFQAIVKLIKFKPSVVVGAGSFTSVPVIFAAKFLNIPVLIHQQDIRPSLSNLLVRGIVDRITVTFKKSLEDFKRKKAIHTGNPFRSSIKDGDKQRFYRNFGMKSELPVVFIMGGGTGAQFINELVVRSFDRLVEQYQIVHTTGEGKSVVVPNHSNYVQREFISDEIPDVFAAADVVVSRAGLSSITELSALGKPSIIIPIPNSHQEDNAHFLKSQNAAIILTQDDTTPHSLLTALSKLFDNTQTRESLSIQIRGLMPHDAALQISNQINEICKK